MLVGNQLKVQNNLDEAGYCKLMASKQVAFFKQDKFFIDAFLTII